MTGWDWRILQDGVRVAGGWSQDEDATRATIEHYASLYEEDGPVTVEWRFGRQKWCPYQSKNRPLRED